MRGITGCVMLGIFLFLSGMDIRLHKIPGNLLAVTGMGVVLYHLLARESNVLLLAGGTAVGVLFLFISRATGESLGYGDSLGILVLGLYLGLWGILEVLSVAFFLLGLAAVFLLSVKKLSRRCVLPFFPFLTAGYICRLFMEGL